MLKCNLLPAGLLVFKDRIGLILFITFKELQFKRVPFLSWPYFFSIEKWFKWTIIAHLKTRFVIPSCHHGMRSSEWVGKYFWAEWNSNQLCHIKGNPRRRSHSSSVIHCGYWISTPHHVIHRRRPSKSVLRKIWIKVGHSIEINRGQWVAVTIAVH